MKTVEEMIAIMKAYEDGKNIEAHYSSGSLDLTWQDIKRIVEIADLIIPLSEWKSEEEYYTEVLKQFNEE